MAIRRVLRAGHPTVRDGCDRYPEEKLGSEDFERLVDDMFESMRDYDGVGLAAPQIQEPYRIVVYELRDNDRYDVEDEVIEPTVLVNPSIVARSDSTVTDWEGCLSLPDLRGKVPRSESITVEALHPSGETVRREASGFEARVIQHELDHLDGTLFVDRMEDLSTLSYLDEYHEYHADEESS